MGIIILNMIQNMYNCLVEHVKIVFSVMVSIVTASINVS